MSSCLVCFRNKCGIWGWRSEKMETVSGYEAKAGEPSGGGWGRRRGPGTRPLLRIHPVWRERLSSPRAPEAPCGPR